MNNFAKEFIKYCQANNFYKVIVCLPRSVDINTVSEDEDICDSGLTIAALKHYPELLEILISHNTMDYIYK